MSVGLATAAVGLIAPYLAAVGEGAAKAVGEETAKAGAKLLGWLRGKLTDQGKEALAELEEEPGSQFNQDDLRVQLAGSLEKDPELVAELRALLAAAPSRGDTMIQNVGADGKAAQIRGDRNKTFIA